MSDSAIALSIFGSEKAVLATDATAGVHTLKVTTNAASDGIVVEGFAAAKYVIGTAKAGGVHTLCATTGAANAAIALQGAAGEKIVLGTVLSGGVHTIAVTTGAANASVLVDSFGMGLVRLATVLAGGVHTLAVNTTANGALAASTFGAGENAIATALAGGVHSLTVSGLQPPFDPAAQAYIDATGELFPVALNDLVLGIKAAGLWDNHIGSIKKAIGVPSLAASMIDLRNTAFNGTAVNNPAHSATAGWTFVGASSQYINSVWEAAAAGSKASQNSAHLYMRIRAATTGTAPSYNEPNGNFRFGILNVQVGLQYAAANDDAVLITNNANNTGNYLISRTGATARTLYRNAVSIGADAKISSTPPIGAMLIGARVGPQTFWSGRCSLWCAGAGLDASQVATLEGLFNTYATAAGET